MEERLYELHASVCKIMASPKRLKLINTLRDKEMTVGELVHLTGMGKVNVSQHLAVLREKGIVTARRDGMHIYYKLANPKVLQACELMREVLFDQFSEQRQVLERAKKVFER
ncbi:MAG: winged helix-turn-helix transcriptional regulator [candidate division NC10 bacterium]|nr:winged helix-turn-helix transcriptional regulator [candidate division NC10 bacterium]